MTALRTHWSAIFAWLFICPTVITGACTYPATEVLIVIDSNAPRTNVLTIVASVSAVPGSTAASTQQWIRDPASTQSIHLPASFAVVPGMVSASGLVQVEIEGRVRTLGPAGGDLVIHRRVRFSFTPHQTAVVPVFLSVECGRTTTGCQDTSTACTFDQLCQDQGLSCGEHGECVAIEVTPQVNQTVPLATDAGQDVTPFQGFTMVSASGGLTCGVARGEAYCWGNNPNGQLGDGTTINRASPQHVLQLAPGAVTSIGAGGQHVCAIVSGDVWCWGLGVSGELGDGLSASSSTPVRVSMIPTGTAVDVVAGDKYTCALAGGQVYCWGVNNVGQLGNGTNNASPVPVLVHAFTSGGVTQIASDQDHCCAIVNGGAHCWGHDDSGNGLGSGSAVAGGMSAIPLPVANMPSGIISITMGDFNGCVSWLGSAWCWGTGAEGELGNGQTMASASPVQVMGLTEGVTQISSSAGDFDNFSPGGHTCAVHNGAALCWGYESVGDGVHSNSLTPVPVAGLSSGVVAVSAGFKHACALLETGMIMCWGEGTMGGLGNGMFASSNAPVQVIMP